MRVGVRKVLGETYMQVGVMGDIRENIYVGGGKGR
jgi:hypothetical protein